MAVRSPDQSETTSTGVAATVEFSATAATRRALKPVEGEEIVVQVQLPNGREVDLPDELASLLRFAVREAAEGRRMALVLLDEEVTPAKAARLLGLSRQYVDRLIADGALPARRLPRSTHRRLRLADVLAFAAERDRRQEIITNMVDTLTDTGAEY